jgi:indolepyruvate ferredoxin oxidoreductase alpha subunit
MGNEAIALGLVEGGCRVVASYPGTPSSEILPAVLAFSRRWELGVYAEWSVNEKVALDQAFAAAMVGKRAACCMKQVGLNVACDSLMSAAYVGVLGGLVVVSCDDPGPHSSQTEQDSRLLARVAKIPVLDPSTPAEARSMARGALVLSERFQLPVMLRSVTRLSHARQDLPVAPVRLSEPPPARFVRDVTRWAATPRFRHVLHRKLNAKLDRMAAVSERHTHRFFEADGREAKLGIIAGGVPFQVVREILLERRVGDVPLLKVGMPFPFPMRSVARFMARCRWVLVLEEPDGLMELQLPGREKAWGRMTGHVPREGDLWPETVWEILDRCLVAAGLQGRTVRRRIAGPAIHRVLQEVALPQRRPTLCAGCPHRASFYAIKRAFPDAVFTSDIGCYTLGANLGGVDTVLDMGSGITLASGIFQAFHQDGREQPIVATMGDSTFYHSGSTALINAVHNGARFVLVLLDNEVTAMTGMQPTPAWDRRVNGSPGRPIPLERLVAGCGVEFLEVHDPYDLRGFMKLLKRAGQHVRSPEGGVAVVIARHPCLIARRDAAKGRGAPVRISDRCGGCRHCVEAFECPALLWNPEQGRVNVDARLCTGCGVCVAVCPKKAIGKTADREDAP